MSFLVYELERGWSFDGYYIPHLLTVNWFFREDPFTYKGIQKMRIHGLTQGRAQIQVAMNGMQTDYLDDFTEPQYIDLPRNPTFINTELKPVTTYTDVEARGLAIQFQFTGHDIDMSKPEPPHVIQVLAVQTSPGDVGIRAH